MIPAMGRDRSEQATPDLFSTDTVGDASLSPIKPVPATQPTADASSHRHVLPKNLRKAVKHLSDGELDLLHAATLEEMGRRGRLPPTDQTANRSSRTDKSSSHKQRAELAAVSLTCPSRREPPSRFRITRSPRRRAFAWPPHVGKHTGAPAVPDGTPHALNASPC
jgi:hypothetical protein